MDFMVKAAEMQEGVGVLLSVHFCCNRIQWVSLYRVVEGYAMGGWWEEP